MWAARAAAQKAAPAKAADAGKKKEQSAPAATPGVQETHVPVNNFNDGEVRQLLSRGGASSVYKLDAPNTSSADCEFVYDCHLHTMLTSVIAGCMANGKSFKVHLDEQVAAALKKQQEEEK